jgi:uncharacterized damage-inducible protein DinB
MQLISKPTTLPSFYQQYLDCVPEDGKLIQHLQEIIPETETLMASLSEDQLLYRYSEGKWSVKDIILHLADCERVIIYRAMRFARADMAALPGFDENIFAATANADQRTIGSLLSELKTLRAASIAFIESLEDEALNRTGTANGYELSARLLVNHVYGHHRHHLNIIQERYLN